MLRMDQQVLAERAGVPRSTVAGYEGERLGARSSSLKKLREVLEAAGATFIETEAGAGVIVTHHTSQASEE